MFVKYVLKGNLLVCLICLTSACSSVGTHQVYQNGEWVNKERYLCKGAGCEVDFKEKKMKGGSFIPPIPPIKFDN